MQYCNGRGCFIIPSEEQSEDPIPQEDEPLFRGLMVENLRRGKVLAYAAMIVEAVFAVVDMIADFLRVHRLFRYDAYLIMYLLMLAACGVFVVAANHFGDPEIQPINRVRRFHVAMVIYITFVMTWGSVITLMDQQLYGQLIVFIINMLACSVFFAMSARSFAIPYVLSCAALLIGLPMAQHTYEVLIGHYVNSGFAILVSWIASRMLYRQYCSDFTHKAMLEQANRQLQGKVAECDLLNEKLSQANDQLKEASLLDELTGIPNRRSFRLFVDRLLSELPLDEMLFSVLMIDIDFFKRYNDRYGHTRGDEVLKAVAGAIERNIDCEIQHVVRWGGEEFLCALVHAPGENVLSLARKVQGAVQTLEILHEDSDVAKTLSVSIGCATKRLMQRSDISQCIEKADQAMYRAKTAGRNQCCVDWEKTCDEAAEE